MTTSTTEMTRSGAFALFPYLPFELRDQIWNEALPEPPSGPALYFYRERGLWQPFDIPEADPGSVAGVDNLVFRFCTELLDPLDNQIHPLSLSLLGVNREARRVALKWIDMHDIHWQGKLSSSLQNMEQMIFFRPFKPALDALYIPNSKWYDFCLEPMDRGFEPDLLGRMMSIHGHELERIAISQSLLVDADNNELIALIPEMIEQWLPNVGLLYVVLDDDKALLSNDPKQRRTATTTEQGPWRWEILQGDYFDWNHTTRESDYIEDKRNEAGGSQAQNDDISLLHDRQLLLRTVGLPAQTALREELIKCGIRRLEVRPALAVRR